MQPAREVLLCETLHGPMLVFTADQVIGHLLASQGHFGEARIDEVLKFLEDGQGFVPTTFVDIGANIGTHLLHALRSASILEAIGVEADPDNFLLLRANVAMQGRAAVTRLFELALSEAPGSVEMELCPSNFGDHRVRVAGVVPDRDLGESARRTRQVPAETADALFRREQVDLGQALVWMDTQGHEGHILAGGTASLAQARAMVMEFWPYGLERAGGRERYFQHLRQAAAVYDINRPDWQRSGRVSVEELQGVYEVMLRETRADHYPHTDLLCLQPPNPQQPVPP